MGLGDHGKAGINAFLQQHRCSTFCSQMKLPRLKLIEEDNDEDGRELNEESDGAGDSSDSDD